MDNTPNDNLPEYYTLEDIAKLFNIHRVTAGRLVRSADFPRITVGHTLRIPRLLFNQWIIDNLFKSIRLNKNDDNTTGGDE